jgi:hypothetical protein
VTEENVSFRLPGALAKDVERSDRATELLARYNRTPAAR